MAWVAAQALLALAWAAAGEGAGLGAELLDASIWRDAPGRFRGATPCEPDVFGGLKLLRLARKLNRTGASPMRKLVPAGCSWEPPVLWSFPGSGNTWMRQMLETATGFATGSVYNDNSLLSIFPAERHCANDVVAVKAHAMFTPYEFLRNWTVPPAVRERVPLPWHGGQAGSPGKWHVEWAVRQFSSKCRRWRPKRALIIDREPYGAIWSEYQRQFVGGANGGHVARISPSDFDPLNWLSAATHAAAGYAASMTSHVSFVRDLGEVGAAAARARGADNDAVAAARAAAAREAVAVVPFADLTSRCEATLARVLLWLAPPEAGGAESAVADAASSPDVARAQARWEVARACGRADGAIKRGAGSAAERFIGKGEAWTELVSCRVWATLGHVAASLGHEPPLPCHSRDELALALAAGAAGLPPPSSALPGGGPPGGGAGSAAHDDEAVLFVSVSKGELDVCLNWLLSALPARERQAAGGAGGGAPRWGGRLLIGAEGWAEFDALAALNAPVFPLIPRYISHGAVRASEGDVARDGVRLERGEVCAALVGAGHAVVTAEADAVWGGGEVARALRGAAAKAQADLVALAVPWERARLGLSAGGAEPPAHAAAALSLALGRWSPSAGAAALLSRVVRDAPASGGDEGALNLLLLRTAPADWAQLPAGGAHGGGWLVTVRLRADAAGGGPPAVARILLLAEAARTVSCDGADAGCVLDAVSGGGAAALVARCLPFEPPANARAHFELGGLVARRLRLGGLWLLPVGWHTAARGARPALPAPALPADAARAALSADGAREFGAALDAILAPAAFDVSVVVTLAWARSPMARAAAARADGAAGAPAAPGAQEALDALAASLAAGAARAGLRLELLAVDWEWELGSAAARPALRLPALPVEHARALSVRLVRVGRAAHTLALRRHAASVASLDSAAFNAGVRLATAELVLCASLGTELLPPFFDALKAVRAAREPAGALRHAGGPGAECRPSGLRPFLVPVCLLPQRAADAAGGSLEGAASAACPSRATPSAAAGLLMPAAAWHAVRGLPESVAAAPHADRYLASALEMLNLTAGWLPCELACAAAPQRGWARWWRVGPAEVHKVDSMRGAMRGAAQLGGGGGADGSGAGGGGMAACAAERAASATARYGGAGGDGNAVYMSAMAAETEVRLLRDAQAGAGVDSSCRWGLLGQELSVASSGGAEAPAPLRVPELQHLADQPPTAGCQSAAGLEAAWLEWTAFAMASRPLLVVHVEGGLGNRLRALLSGWAMADELGYLFAAVWEPNVECGARFDELFQRDERFLVLERKPRSWPTSGWREYALGDEQAFISREHSVGTSVYVRTQLFVRSRLRKHSLQAYAERFAWLRPRPELARLVRRIAIDAHLPTRVGAHVRMSTNHTGSVFGLAGLGADLMRGSGGAVAASHFQMHNAEAEAAYAARRNACHWRGFGQTLMQLARADTRLRFFVACDDNACHEGLRDTIGAGRVSSMADYVPCARSAGCNADSRAPLCQALGLIEIHLMSLSRHVLLSQPSSFSDAMRMLMYGRWLHSTRQGAPRLPGPFAQRASVHCGSPMNFLAHLGLESFGVVSPQKYSAGLPIGTLVERVRQRFRPVGDGKPEAGGRRRRA